MKCCLISVLSTSTKIVKAMVRKFLLHVCNRELKRKKLKKSSECQCEFILLCFRKSPLLIVYKDQKRVSMVSEIMIIKSNFQTHSTSINCIPDLKAALEAILEKIHLDSTEKFQSKALRTPTGTFMLTSFGNLIRGSALEPSSSARF